MKWQVCLCHWFWFVPIGGRKTSLKQTLIKAGCAYCKQKSNGLTSHILHIMCSQQDYSSVWTGIDSYGFSISCKLLFPIRRSNTFNYLFIFIFFLQNHAPWILISIDINIFVYVLCLHKQVINQILTDYNLGFNLFQQMHED